ncbi:hypothetical protein NPIL_687371 [Nephila pilipes]|uniref:Uncharacterized protein n=1 Tax=Nephila pilipes TaxID=299642 RepID=A0A8X6U823_NEPPI|nr:hypothetical protein NPIL_687371 [Nephila pilipes]
MKTNDHKMVDYEELEAASTNYEEANNDDNEMDVVNKMYGKEKTTKWHLTLSSPNVRTHFHNIVNNLPGAKGTARKKTPKIALVLVSIFNAAVLNLIDVNTDKLMTNKKKRLKADIHIVRSHRLSETKRFHKFIIYDRISPK